MMMREQFRKIKNSLKARNKETVAVKLMSVKRIQSILRISRLKPPSSTYFKPTRDSMKKANDRFRERKDLDYSGQPMGRLKAQMLMIPFNKISGMQRLQDCIRFWDMAVSRTPEPHAVLNPHIVLGQQSKNWITKYERGRGLERDRQGSAVGTRVVQSPTRKQTR